MRVFLWSTSSRRKVPPTEGLGVERSRRRGGAAAIGPSVEVVSQPLCSPQPRPTSGQRLRIDPTWPRTVFVSFASRLSALLESPRTATLDAVDSIPTPLLDSR